VEILVVVVATASGGAHSSTSASEREADSVMCMYLFIDRLEKAFRGEATFRS
jgi:hypothetical protein